jgi:hypothetical protein
MLTAATVALLSGPAFGATDITTKTTKPLTAANDGPITLDTNGTIVIPSSSSAVAAASAIELNSTTPANNIFTGIIGTTLSYNDTPFAEAVQGDPNVTGEIISGGSVSVTGSGTNKSAFLFGDPTLLTSGTFTGTADSVNNSGRVTALYVQAGSTVAAQGDGSSDITVLTNNTVVGDIVVGGQMTDEATSLTAVSNAQPVMAVNMSGTLTGNLSIVAGGSINTTGGGSEGIVDTGTINGSIINFGTVATTGVSTTLTAKQQQEEASGQSVGQKTTGNPQGGSALIVSGNVTGGIYNGGPGASDTGTVPGVISTVGSLPAVDITPGFNQNASTTVNPVTIGTFADPDGDFVGTSFLNRGTITGVADNLDSAAGAIQISGFSTSAQTTLTNGFVNAGTVSAAAVTDAHSTATGSLVTALSIGNFVTLGGNQGTAGNGFGGGYALVNSNENGTGSISATVSGIGPGTAVAVEIGSTSSATGSSVPSLFNSGTISASASSTDLTIANLSAFAILDNSGSLTTITNSGTISATSSILNNFANIARAISVQNAASGVTITNTGTIVGDVLLSQHADTISVVGASLTQPSILSGNIYFGGNIDAAGSDALIVGNNATVTGNILEQVGSTISVSVASAGVLDVTNNGLTVNNQALAAGLSPGLAVNSLSVNAGGTLDLILSQAFNQQSTGGITPVVQGIAASGNSGTITLSASSILNLNFGSFVAPTTAGNTTSQFVIFDAPSGQLIIQDAQTISNDITKDIPFLFNGSICGVGAGMGGFTACSTTPEGAGRSDLVLNLTPKLPGVDPLTGGPDANYLGLTGYAAKMFPLANQALANDTTLGAAVIAAGNNLTGTDVPGQGQKIYQGIYSAFAPDVTGADRAIAISITDQATGPVGARQRALRMYAGLDGEATMWGQEFGQRLNTGNSATTTGYANTGFGFALGADSGNPHDGRYGGAFTFYSGTTSEKAPRTSKTQSDWIMLTGYSDWRGRGFFVDTQLSAAYGDITSKRAIVINDVVAKCNEGETCIAQGKRPAAMLAGGVTTGKIYHSGGTVFIPQISIDGMTMREDGYTEATPNLVTQATSGFDLHVKPYYASSVRAFVGADLRQDLKFGDYFVQPEGRVGFRYDALDGAEKLKAEFACSNVATGSCGNTSFSISGPDPAKGNLVIGGGIAVSTGAWSLGLSYDYLRGIDGVKDTDQVATFSLIGRI